MPAPDFWSAAPCTGLHELQRTGSRDRQVGADPGRGQVLHDLLVPVRPELRDPARAGAPGRKALCGPLRLATADPDGDRFRAQPVLRRRHPDDLRAAWIVAVARTQASLADAGDHGADPDPEPARTGARHPFPGRTATDARTAAGADQAVRAQRAAAIRDQDERYASRAGGTAPDRIGEEPGLFSAVHRQALDHLRTLPVGHLRGQGATVRAQRSQHEVLRAADGRKRRCCCGRDGLCRRVSGVVRKNVAHGRVLVRGHHSAQSAGRVLRRGGRAAAVEACGRCRHAAAGADGPDGSHVVSLAERVRRLGVLRHRPRAAGQAWRRRQHRIVHRLLRRAAVPGAMVDDAIPIRSRRMAVAIADRPAGAPNAARTGPRDGYESRALPATRMARPAVLRRRTDCRPGCRPSSTVRDPQHRPRHRA